MSSVKSEAPDAFASFALMQARLMRAQAIAKIGSWELDLATRKLWASAEALRIYGLDSTVDSLIELSTVQAMALPTYRPSLDQALADLISGVRSYDVEFEIRRHGDGEIRHIHSLAELVRDKSGNPCLVSGTIRDDTEVVARDRAMAAALRASEEQLQLRQRMDSIGVLMSGIANDFNNDLAGIMGYTCLLAESATKLDAAQTECVQNILHATQRAADLVHSLRALSHPEPSEPATFDFFELSADLVRVLRSTTDPIITKELQVKPGTCLVRGNASNLYHALMNLGVNAIQAIEQKGPTSEDRVTIGARSCDMGPDDSLGLGPGRYVHVTVSDTGPGMTDEVRQHAFEPWFSTGDSSERHRPGLGLAMVYNVVVRQHGGAVHLETLPGQGCCVHLYLPSSEEMPRSTPSIAPDTPHGTERILVVEDEPQLARLTRTVLERLGYTVLVAADGPEAVDLFEREGDSIDLVVLDRTLPGLQGERVFARLTTVRPNLRVIVTSGNASLSASDFPGAYCILKKPYLPTLLGSVIREALDAKEPRGR